jgi:hypothetical protein
VQSVDCASASCHSKPAPFCHQIHGCRGVKVTDLHVITSSTKYHVTAASLHISVTIKHPLEPPPPHIHTHTLSLKALLQDCLACRHAMPWIDGRHLITLPSWYHRGQAHSAAAAAATGHTICHFTRQSLKCSGQTLTLTTVTRFYSSKAASLNQPANDSPPVSLRTLTVLLQLQDYYRNPAGAVGSLVLDMLWKYFQ